MIIFVVVTRSTQSEPVPFVLDTVFERFDSENYITVDAREGVQLLFILN